MLYVYYSFQRVMGAIQCTVRFFYLGALLILVGTVLFTCFAFTVLLPHVRTRDWPETLCIVQNSTYLTDVCACSQVVTKYSMCYKKFPCLRVEVSYMFDNASRPLDSNAFLGNFTSTASPVVSNVVDVVSSPSVALNDTGQNIPITGVLYRKWKEAFQETVGEC